MNKILSIALLLVLTACLFTGCRNRNNDTTVPSSTSTVPHTTAATTAPTVAPMPSMTLPHGTDTTPATNGTDGVLDPADGGMARGRSGPRY